MKKYMGHIGSFVYDFIVITEGKTALFIVLNVYTSVLYSM
jgi:hypothetical protein